RGGKLAVQVTDSEKKSISGVEVQFQDWGIWHGVDWQARTDTDGRFEWANAPLEKVQLDFRKPGFITSRRLLVPTEHTIELKRALVLSGHVTEEQSGKPIEKFKIAWANRKDWLDNALYSGRIEGNHGRYEIDLNNVYDQ